MYKGILLSVKKMQIDGQAVSFRMRSNYFFTRSIAK